MSQDKPRHIPTLVPPEPVQVGELPEFKRFFSEFDLDGGKTEEQWAEHDAKIATQLEAERPRRIAEDARRRRHSYCVDLDWPVRAYDAALVADDSKPALSRLKTWNTDEENVIVLSGPAGCGKTVAAAWWAVNNSKYSPVFLRATTFAASSRYDSDKRGRWMNASSLVLDDLGAEYADSKGNFLVDLDELVDTFYGDKRPLLITTNASAPEFKQRYGERIADRIRECGTFASIANTSLRGKS